MARKTLRLILLLALSVSVGCSKEKDEASTQPETAPPPQTVEPVPEEPPPPPKYLYVASGLCQAGQNTTFTATTASNLVYRLAVETGQRADTGALADYNKLPASFGETPVSIAPFDDDHLLVLVEKAGARKVEKVSKSVDAPRVTLTSDTGLLANTLTRLVPGVGSSFVVARVNGMGLMTSMGLTAQANFVTNNPGAPCGTSNAKYASIQVTKEGHILFVNSAANNNRIGVIRKTGGTASCLSGLNAPQTGAWPTAIQYIASANQVLVAYAGNTTLDDINSIYVYDLTEDATSATLSNPVQVYDASEFPGTYPYLLYGISAMAHDSESGHLYLATAITANSALANFNYVIEKFTYDPTTKSLTRIGDAPFYGYGADTKCISEMFVGH